MKKDKAKFLVVGAGAVGAYFGGRLAQAGCKVSVTCRSEYDVVKEKGFEIKSVDGDFHFEPENVYKQTSEITEYPDYVIVSLKALPEVDTVEIIKSAVGPETVILLLQNGIDIEQPVTEVFPENEILRALAFICVSRTSPGHVNHVDFGLLTLGKFPVGQSKKADLLGEFFNSAGVKTTVTDDIIAGSFKKLAWNAAFNPLSVAYKMTTKEILDNPETAKFAENIMKEVCEIAKFANHPLPQETVPDLLKATKNMKPYKTSMLQDYENGKPLETEVILGNTLRISQKLGIEVPNISKLYEMMQKI